MIDSSCCLDTVLIVAATYGLEGVSRRILARDPAACRRVDSKGKFPLYHAASNGRAGVVGLLLSADDTVEYGDVAINGLQGDSIPLERAVCANCPVTVQTLLDDPRVRLNLTWKPSNQQPGKEINVLDTAFERSYWPVIKCILDDNRWKSELTDFQKLDLLLFSMLRGKLVQAKMLVAGINPTARHLMGRTSLMVVLYTLGDDEEPNCEMEGQYESLVREICCHGDIDLTATDGDGQSAVWYAANAGMRPSIMRCLVSDFGHPPDIPDNPGWTPLALCAARGYAKGVSILLESGQVNINSQNNQGCTPLMAAVSKSLAGRRLESQCNDMVLLLLSKGADPHTQDIRGRTALVYAAADGFHGSVRILLEHGALVDPEHVNGRTALSYAAEKGYEKVTEVLLEAGADPNSCDEQGQTPYDYAARKPSYGVYQDTGHIVEDPDGWKRAATMLKETMSAVRKSSGTPVATTVRQEQ
ncbi:hypothetical protein EsH8_VII_000165 [Colletotrichum jinshuiense]